MEKTVRRFDINRYATPKNEEDRRTLSEHDYRTLKGEEALECIKGLEGLTLGDLDIERLPVLLAEGIIELRYYREGAEDIKGIKERGEKGDRVFVYFKKAERILPIALRESGERLSERFKISSEDP